MFENYNATEKDFKAIEEGIKTVWHSKLNFVFKNKKIIRRVVVVSYDSKKLYIWSQTKLPKFIPIKCSLKQYFMYKIPHQLKISDNYQYGWRAGLQPEELTWLLFSKMKTDKYESTSFVSGGLLIPFITLQKKMKNRKNNPYTTYESYLATIVHEFGHAYWNQKMFANYKKQDAREVLVHAEASYKQNLNKNRKLIFSKLIIPLPPDYNISEIFAFCAEYQAATLFWPTHKKAVDRDNSSIIKNFLKSGKFSNIFLNVHYFVAIIGKLIFSAYPHDWPIKLLSPRYF